MQYASQPEASLEGLKEELARFEGAYGAAPPLAAKWKLLSDFLRGTYAGIQAGLVQRSQQAARDEAASAQRRAAELERSAHQASPLPPSLAAIFLCLCLETTVPRGLDILAFQVFDSVVSVLFPCVHRSYLHSSRFFSLFPSSLLRFGEYNTLQPAAALL